MFKATTTETGTTQREDFRIDEFFQGQLQYTCDVARGTKMAGGELNAYNLYPLVTALW